MHVMINLKAQDCFICAFISICKLKKKKKIEKECKTRIICEKYYWNPQLET